MNLQVLEVLRPPPSKAIFARRDASIVLEPKVEGFKEGSIKVEGFKEGSIKVEGFKEGSIKVEGFKGGSMRDCRGSTGEQ